MLTFLKNKKVLFLSLVIFLIYFSYAAVSKLTFLFSQMTVIEALIHLTPKTPLQGVNILAFGVDQTKTSKRADTIIVLHLDNENKHIGVLSIPRDTYVKIEGHGSAKINHAYAYGGVRLLQDTVSSFLSVPINHYIKVDLKSVSSLIDNIGGIKLNVEKDLHYIDYAGDLHIDVKKGKQTLGGDQVVQYLRFRQDNEGDIGRIRRQQTFLKAFANKLSQSGKFIELPKIMREVSKTIKTDLSKKQMIGLSVQFSDAFKQGNIDKGTVPGAISLIAGRSVWKPNISYLDKVIERTIFGFNQRKMVAESKIKTVDENASTQTRRKVTLKELNRVANQTELEESKTMDQLNLRVEVLNGVGIPGSARRIASGLKNLGLSVPRFGNAGSFKYQETLIVDWKGNLDKSILLAHSMSIDPSKIIVYDKPTKSLDFTIVLGQDWEQIYDALIAQVDEIEEN